ncbi:plantaricin C family lantibiotic [Bacillus swezeyi]|uniref:plantaricin C family lantibiotic n=1 Tax=Bacillus swezeyi TaxID=1925020 RepID=UPI002E201F72|nr:plantaricin C family lantibiotic [Bacillus swezeyi]
MSKNEKIQMLRDPLARNSTNLPENPVGNILEEIDNNDLLLAGGDVEGQSLIVDTKLLSAFLGDKDGVCTITKECQQWC